MRLVLLVAALLPLACAVPKEVRSVETPVWVLSSNHSDVDVYLLCGARNPLWLGVVAQQGDAVFRIPAGRTQCVSGLNFFLVPRDHQRGYWVGPVRPRFNSRIELVIEKYAGLSGARLRRHGG